MILKSSRKRFTKEQMQLQRIIEEMGFQTILEYPAGDYAIDCFLPELGIGLEWDGPLHKTSKKRDKGRDAIILSELGYNIIRVKDFSSESVEELKAEILSFC